MVVLPGVFSEPHLNKYETMNSTKETLINTLYKNQVMTKEIKMSFKKAYSIRWTFQYFF